MSPGSHAAITEERQYARHRGAAPPRGSGRRQGRLAALGPIPLASAPGAPCARTTAPTATPGTTSPTTTRAAAPTAGTRTASAASATRASASAWRSPCGTRRTRFLKERIFGLSNQQGNHGEDVKEYYFFLDGTPTHSYMKMLYKYPQVAYPVRASWSRSTASATRRSRSSSCSTRSRDTFTANRYFDVFIEYAKANPEDMLCRITAVNRGPEAAPIHVLPHLWYRNTWSWRDGRRTPGDPRHRPRRGVHQRTARIGERWWYVRARRRARRSPLHRERHQLRAALRRAQSVAVREGRHPRGRGRRQGRPRRTTQQGSKLAGHVRAVVAPGALVRGGGALLRRAAATSPSPTSTPSWPAASPRPTPSTPRSPRRRSTPTSGCVSARPSPGCSGRSSTITTTSTAGSEAIRRSRRRPSERWHGRNRKWKELHNADVILMPDTWEYPWYASWDLAFHCVAMAHIDPEFAKAQLLPDGRRGYQHANGQFPAYEWDFDDVNPPLLGWAAWRVYRIDRDRAGRGRPRVPQGDVPERDAEFQLLGQSQGRERARRLRRRVPGHGQHRVLRPRQAAARRRPARAERRHELDGAVSASRCSPSPTELARHDPVYQNMAIRYFEHFLYIAHAMTNMDGAGIYALGRGGPVLLRRRSYLTSGESIPMRDPVDGRPRAAVRRARGLADRDPPASIASPPAPGTFVDQRPDLLEERRPVVHAGREGQPAMSMLPEERLRAVLRRMLDPAEFLSDYGIRVRLALPPRASLRLHSRRPGVLGEVPARRIGQPAVRRQLELARADLVPRELHDRPLAARVRAATTATGSRSSARPAPGRCCNGSTRSPAEIARRLVAHVPPRPEPAAGGAPPGATTNISRPIRTGATASRSSSTSTATRAPASARATRPAGRRWSASLLYEYWEGRRGGG